MPGDIQNVLQSYFHCASVEETMMWEHVTAGKIIACAEILPPEQGSYLGERAYCPLCGSGSNSYYERGFAIPDGLLRHLLGEGNSYRCMVFKTACKLAKDYWYREFHEETVRSAKEHAAHILRRRKNDLREKYESRLTSILEKRFKMTLLKDEAHSTEKVQ
jgi:hypothetical protein